MTALDMPQPAGRKPTLAELWAEAAGDTERYLELMREHGHLVDCPCPCGHEGGHCPKCRPRLPCGWGAQRKPRPPGEGEDELWLP